MTQDYAKPSTTRKPSARGKKAPQKKAMVPTPPPPKKNKAKLVTVLIALIAVFSYALYSLQKIPPTQTPETQSAKQARKNDEAKDQQTTNAQEAPKQRFKFYDLLPESEVVPPKVDAYKFKEKGRSESYYYMVQTGSFRSIQDAEKQKATIAFQGLKASIKAVQNNQGSTWHRVITGPFNNRSEMNDALDKLVAINIEPLVKKVKK